MKDLKGTKTEANLAAAFAGEAQAHTKYLYYAARAKKDGYVQISKLFEETAHNEKEHAKLWFKYLHGGSMPDTMTNQRMSALVRQMKDEGLLVRTEDKRKAFFSIA